MKKLVILFSLLFCLTYTTNAITPEESMVTSCMDVAISFANAELANEHISHGEWFGRVRYYLSICNEQISP